MDSNVEISIAEAFAWTVQWLDEGNIVVLAIIALFLRLVGEQLQAKSSWKPAARYLSCLFLIIYLLHLSHSIDWFDDVVGVVAVLLRVSLATFIFHVCISVPVFFLLQLVVRFVQTEIANAHTLVKNLADQHQVNLKIRELESRKLRGESTPREETLRRSIHQAQVDFEFECDLLNNSGLDEEELEVAIEQSKKKYLQRLKNALI